MARRESIIAEGGGEVLRHLGAVGVTHDLTEILKHLPDQIASSGALPAASAILAGLAGGPLAWGAVLIGGCLLHCRKSRCTAQESRDVFRKLYRKLCDIEEAARKGGQMTGLLDELLGQNLALKERLEYGESGVAAFAGAAEDTARELGLEIEKFRQDVRDYFTTITSQLADQFDSLWDKADRIHVDVQSGFDESKTRDEQQARKLDEMLERVKRVEAAHQLEASSKGLPPLTDDERRIARRALQSSSALTRAKAAIALGDFAKADDELRLTEPVLEDAFAVLTAKGDRHYFAREFDEAVPWYERAFNLPHRDKDATASSNLALALQRSHRGDASEQVDRAIELHHGTLLLRKPGSPDWAKTQNNLGLAWLHKPTGDRCENIDKAIEAFTSALTVYSRNEFPDEWAVTQNNLGIAWQNMPRRKRENMLNALKAYTDALSVIEKEPFTRVWAMVQGNFGSALVEIAKMTAGKDSEYYLEGAFRALTGAMVVFTRAHFPIDWAKTRANLGVLLMVKARRDVNQNIDNDDATIDLAIEAFGEARSVYTRDRFPAKWAEVQNNLGGAWLDKPKGDRAENSDKAIEAFTAALTVYNCEGFPVDWARTQSNLGDAWLRKPAGKRDENANKAIAAYTAALSVYTKERFPAEWARTKNNLGIAWTMKLMGDRSATLLEAISCFEDALSVCRPADFPKEHAETRRNLHRARMVAALDTLETVQRNHPGDHLIVAKHINAAAYALEMMGDLKQAERGYREAHEMARRVCTGTDHPAVATSLHDLACFLSSHGRETEAEPLFVEVLAMRRRLFDADHSEVDMSLFTLATVRSRMEKFDEAEPLYEELLALRSRILKGDHPAVAICLNYLGTTHQHLGKTEQAERSFEEAVAMYRRLFPEGHPELAANLSNLSQIRYELNRFQDALELSAEAVTMAERLLPADHPDLKNYRAGLAACRKAASP